MDTEHGIAINGATDLADLDGRIASMPPSVRVIAPEIPMYTIASDGQDSVTVRYKKPGASSIPVTKTVTVTATGAVTSEVINVALDVDGEGLLVLTSTEGGIVIALGDGANIVRVKVV